MITNISACALPADAPLRAVVIGAGLAGLATAKALCGLFDEVTLIERDNVAAAPASAEDATQDQVTLDCRLTPQGDHGSSGDALKAAEAVGRAAQ
jgi:flavin-dependent dehydrogenase